MASCSLWWSSYWNGQQALDQMAAQGTTFVMASGDFGCADYATTSYHLNNVTLVGGSILNCLPLVDAAPPATYPTPTYYASEVAWPSSGGGVMFFEVSVPDFNVAVPIPDHQVGIMNLNGQHNGGSLRNRNYPDVAMAAQGIEVFTKGKANHADSGTSYAAPLFAGFIALANQYSAGLGNGLMGFLNPTLYAIGETMGDEKSDLYSVCFNDITERSNPSLGKVNLGLTEVAAGATFNAVAGYDLVTGLGSPKPRLIVQLGQANPLTPGTELTNIHFEIVTGHDNLRGDSQALAHVHLPDGSVSTMTLKAHGAPEWQAGSTHSLDFAVPQIHPPLTEFHGITGVVLQLVAGDGEVFASADNWDIDTLAVSLFSPGTDYVPS